MFSELFESRTLSLLSQEADDFLMLWDPNHQVPRALLFEAFRHRVTLRELVDACSREIRRPSIAANPKALRRAHFLFSAQAELDDYEFRFDGAKKWREEASMCLDLLKLKSKPTVPYHVPFFSGKMSGLKKTITLLDRQRAYWGWTRQLLLNFILLLPLSFSGRNEMCLTLDSFAPWLGSLSYVSLSMHLMIELFLMTKNSLLSPWLTRNSREKVSFLDQFKMQFEARKFGLLDDFLSIASNLIAFLWITGEGNLGAFGPILTAWFRLLYIGLITWRNTELKDTHQLMVARYEADIKALHALESPPQTEIQFLERELTRCKRQFSAKQREYLNELYYVIGLFVSMAFLACLTYSPFAIPITIALAVGFLSYAISFVFMFKFQQGRGRNAILLREEGKVAMDDDIKNTLKFFNSTQDPVLKKTYFLDGQMLVKASQQEALIIQGQKEILLYQSLLKAALPAVILTSFVLLPVYAAWALMFTSMLMTAYMETYMPDAGFSSNAQDNGLDDATYQSFVASPDVSFGLSAA